jgi:hypothetical protein
MTIPTLLLFFGWGLISGRVTGPGGQPVVGAEIWSGYGPSYPAPLLARSVADGAFTLAPPPPGSADDEILVCHDGFLGEKVALAGVLPSARQGKPAAPLAVVLHPVGRIRGRVLAPDGSPLPGTYVAYSNPVESATDDFIPTADPCDPSSTTGGKTDALGRFTLSPPHFTWYEIEARAKGYASTPLGRRLHVEEGETIEGIEIWMTVGATIVGRVLTPTGEPVAGAQVYSSRHGVATDDTVAGTDGSYRLARFAPGPHRVTARIGEGAAASAVAAEIDVSPGENHLDLTLTAQSPPRQITAKVTLGPDEPHADGELDLASAKEFMVSGRVVDPAGQPLAGASLSLEGAGGRSIARTTSGEEGGFSLSVPSGTYTLRGTADGAFLPQPVAVQVADAAVDGVEVVLRPGASIHGRVLGLAPGDPVQISASSPGSSVTQWTADDHTYRLDGLAPGEWTVTAFLYDGPWQRSYVSRKITVPPVLILPAELTLDLVMPPPGSAPP